MYGGTHDCLVELDESGFSVVVYDDHTSDHGVALSFRLCRGYYCGVYIRPASIFLLQIDAF